MDGAPHPKYIASQVERAQCLVPLALKSRVVCNLQYCMWQPRWASKISVASFLYNLTLIPFPFWEESRGRDIMSGGGGIEVHGREMVKRLVRSLLTSRFSSCVNQNLGKKTIFQLAGLTLVLHWAGKQDHVLILEKTRETNGPSWNTNQEYGKNQSPE